MARGLRTIGRHAPAVQESPNDHSPPPGHHGRHRHRSCPGFTPAAAPSRRDTPLLVSENPPNSTDDIHGVGANRPSHEARWNLYDRLMTFGMTTDANGKEHYDFEKREPELAESRDLTPTSVTFKLRRNARFHDATPVTAQDATWSFDSAVTVGGFPTFQILAGRLEKREQFVVLDDHTFRVDVLRAGRARAGRPPRRPPFPADHRSPCPMNPEFDAEAYAKAAAAAVGLPLDPRHLPGVAFNLKLAARMAGLVEGMKLTPADEAAPVFVARRDAPK